MQLSTKRVNDFIAQLGSDSPVPGGGSAAALMGAQGVALITMVSNLTVSKPRYAEHEELNQHALKEGNKLCNQLISLIDRDAKAFSGLTDAYKLPKETQVEKESRSKKIAEATIAATEAPFEMMKLSLEALRLCKTLIGKSNIYASSDLGVSALGLLACTKAAWLNVLINLSGIKSPEMAEHFRTNGEQIIASSQVEADYIYNSIKDAL